ncbi:MAG: DUF1501 domain-containing protein [Planctomycetia bacterium]|nr:DUF1501 domain-containing protein [Planctomycetia bacterium]
MRSLPAGFPTKSVSARRDFMLRLGMLGGTGLTLPRLLQGEAARAAEVDRSRIAATSGRGGKAKACILIYLWGGPPQQDMWDMKPDAPDGIRSEFKPLETVVPGMSFSDQLPLTARQADKMAIVRALTHPSNDHVHSVYHTLTGRDDPTLQGALRQRRRLDFPCIGSVVSHFSKPGTLPSTVTLPRPIGHDGVVYSGTHAGFLGSAHDPLEMQSPGEVKAPPMHSFELPSGLDQARLDDRFSLLAQIESSQRALDDEVRRTNSNLSLFREQAARMLTGGGAKQSFDLGRESDKLRDRYGRNEYGESFLLARRLVESGVRLVTIVWDYITPKGDVANVWDNHGGTGALGKISGYQMLKEKYCLPPLDLAYSALLEDLGNRGLLDETLVAMYGEFGRTPKINKHGGRDHWGACQSAVFAGGGVRGGNIHGASDAHAAYPVDKPVSPEDILATIHHGLGISPESELRDPLGRPYRLVEGRSIVELF